MYISIFQVVRLIKTNQDHPVTAAIGDGANDVSMIQEADVGLGKNHALCLLYSIFSLNRCSETE